MSGSASVRFGISMEGASPADKEDERFWMPITLFHQAVYILPRNEKNIVFNLDMALKGLDHHLGGSVQSMTLSKAISSG